MNCNNTCELITNFLEYISLHLNIKLPIISLRKGGINLNSFLNLTLKTKPTFGFICKLYLVFIVLHKKYSIDVMF